MIPKRWHPYVGALLCIAGTAVLAAAEQYEPIRWYSVDAQKNVKIHVYLFYSQNCSHCQEALRFLNQLESKYAWITCERYETSNWANLNYYHHMSASVGRVAGQVPAFFFCKQMEIGYDSYDRTGKRLEKSMLNCYEHLKKQVDGKAGQTYESRASGTAWPYLLLLAEFQDQEFQPLDLPAPDSKIELPWWGEVDPAQVSLPLLTLVIAGCDAFNPCAFFVLLFLLSLLVHAHSRWRMVVVGSIFVLASGLVYFLFMAAWLNLFFVMGHLRAITTCAGVLAIVIALINIKDFFWFKQGISLTIPESSKPGLFQRMTRLVSEQNLLVMLAGTTALAGITNLYELLCTSGFPMVYTRILTLRELPVSTYYMYLAAYNGIYVLPLMVIVMGFTFTLGSRKLTETQGRTLKLLSGIMMLLLGIVITVAPQLLTSMLAAVVLLALSMALTAVIVFAHRRLLPDLGAKPDVQSLARSH